jgi:hypothetical protein
MPLVKRPMHGVRRCRAPQEFSKASAASCAIPGRTDRVQVPPEGIERTMGYASWGRKAFALVVVAAAIGLGIAAAIVDRSEGHPRIPFIPGKYGWIIWVVAELFWHPVIRIPVLAVLVISAVYVWTRKSDRERQYGAGVEHTVPTSHYDPVPRPPTPAPALALASAPAKTSKVRCHKCQHVQVVPVSQATFACEQCHAELKRRTSERAEHRPG